MKRLRLMTFMTACAAVGLLTTASVQAQERTDIGLEELEEAPVELSSLVLTTKFELRDAYRDRFNDDRPAIDRGVVAVIQTVPQFVTTRAEAMPVLYADGDVVEWQTIDESRGLIVAIIPGEQDLASTRLWFGGPEFMESVDSQRRAAERDRADAYRISSPSALTRLSAERVGDGIVVFENQRQLRSYVFTIAKQFQAK